MISAYPSPVGNALAVAGTLDSAWISSGAALLAHLDAGGAVLVWTAGGDAGSSPSLVRLGIQPLRAEPEALEDRAFRVWPDGPYPSPVSAGRWRR